MKKLSIIETHWGITRRVSTRKVHRVTKRTNREGVNVRPVYRSRRTKR